MKSYYSKIDDKYNMVRDYSLSRSGGVLKRTRIEQNYTPNEDIQEELDESLYDNRRDVHMNFVATMHKGSYKLGMPLYDKVLVYRVKVNIHVPFTATAKLVIYTDYSVVHVFDLCETVNDQTVPLTGEHILSFGVYPDLGTEVTPIEIDTENMTASVINATSKIHDDRAFFAVDAESREMCPIVINVNPRIDESGYITAEALYAEIVGNIDEQDGGFASVEVEIYPVTDAAVG